MDTPIFEAIIVGAGHAGLSASYHLKRLGLKHIVFEKGRIAESWRSQRWDSFVLNTPNRLNVLPGMDHDGNDPDAFCSSWRFVASLEAYAFHFQLPVVEQTEIIAIEKGTNDEYFTVVASHNAHLKTYRTRQVIVCSGGQNARKVPAFARNLSPDIVQLHASKYRNAAQLAKGAVLVVGSAQSGCQVSEDLIDAGRKVFLATSQVGRIPRKYRGKDIMEWLLITGFFDARADEIPDSQLLQMKPPQLTGSGDVARTISLQSLAKKGATIMGRMHHASGNNVSFQPNAAIHVQFADAFSKKVKDMIDGFIIQHGLKAPEPVIDPEDIPDEDASCASEITTMQLEEYGVRSVIWTTGFNADFNYLKLPVLDTQGHPQHKDGISAVEGLYFLGLGWLRTRKSSLILGISEDAAFITEKVYAYSRVLCE